MKFAVPLTAKDSFPPHFGSAMKFMVYDVDTGSRTVRRRIGIIPEGKRPCHWPPLFRAAGVDVVLAGRMSRVARERITILGMQVTTGISEATPPELVAAFLAGTLTSIPGDCEEGCQGIHDHRGH